MSNIWTTAQEPVLVLFEGIFFVLYAVPLLFSVLHGLQSYWPLIFSLMVIVGCCLVLPLLALLLVQWLSRTIDISLELTV